MDLAAVAGMLCWGAGRGWGPGRGSMAEMKPQSLPKAVVVGLGETVSTALGPWPIGLAPRARGLP